MTMKQTSNATRHNKDKVDLSILPTEALIEEAKVWMMGEKKYGRYNWHKLWGDDTVNVVMASLLRHAVAILQGEKLDPESGLDHAAHIRCNAAMLIRYNQQVKQEAKVNPENDVKYNSRRDEPEGAGEWEIVNEDGSITIAEKRKWMDGYHTFYRGKTESDK